MGSGSEVHFNTFVSEPPDILLCAPAVLKVLPKVLRIGHLDAKIGPSLGSKKKIRGTIWSIWSASECDCGCLMCGCDLCVRLVLQSVLASRLPRLIRLLEAQKNNMHKVFPRILFSCLRSAPSLLHW